MTVSAVWTIADIFNGLMALPNMIALFALNGVVVYETKKFFEAGKHKKMKIYIFNQARRNGLESYQPFSGKGRYRTECGRNCTGSTLWADAAGTGDRSCVYKPTETCTLHRGGDCCTDRVKQRRCRADAGAD